jgi:integrase
MPHKRKDSQVWWASFTDQHGKRVRHSTGTIDYKEAQALEAKWRLERYRAKNWGEVAEIAFEEVLLCYLKARIGTPSERDYLMHGRRLKERFAGTVMNTLPAKVISDYIAWRRGMGVANATINRELAVLSAAINYYNREMETNLPNPVKGRLLKEPEGRVRWLQKGEASRLVKAAEQSLTAPHLGPLVRLALNTGMRVQEMLGLEWSRVDLKNGLIYLGGIHTKSKKRRSVPINQEARAALLIQARFRATEYPGGSWVFCHEDGGRIGSVKRSFATACKKAGIKDFRFHDLRHSLVGHGRRAAERGPRPAGTFLDHDDREICPPGTGACPGSGRSAGHGLGHVLVTVMVSKGWKTNVTS